MEWKMSLGTPSTASGWAVLWGHRRNGIIFWKDDGENPMVWDNSSIDVLTAIPVLDHVGWLQNRLKNNTSLLEVQSHLI